MSSACCASVWIQHLEVVSAGAQSKAVQVAMDKHSALHSSTAFLTWPVAPLAFLLAKLSKVSVHAVNERQNTPWLVCCTVMNLPWFTWCTIDHTKGIVERFDKRRLAFFNGWLYMVMNAYNYLQSVGTHLFHRASLHSGSPPVHLSVV